MEENVELKTVSYDELEFPDTLYKYRTWNEAKHKTIISHRQVYMSAPFDFKDPLDCKNQIRYDLLTPMEIFLKYYLDHKKENPHLSHIELSKFAAYWYNKSPVRDKEHIKKLQEEDFIK